MMGTKIRSFDPLPDLSLEDLAPKDNFYRRLEEWLDLSFIRELVEDLYAPSGRPSVDPVVFSEPSQHNTPIEVTPLAAETVRVTDQTHPFYGLELPMVGVTRKARLGAVCVAQCAWCGSVEVLSASSRWRPPNWQKNCLRRPRHVGCQWNRQKRCSRW